MRFPSVFLLVTLVSGTGCMGATIADAKLEQDGQSVSLTAQVVTYVATDFFYIEEGPHTCGIRVDKAGHTLTSGMYADIDGTLGTNADGERRIVATRAVRNGAGFADVGPVCLNNSALGGSDWHWTIGGTAGQLGVKSGRGANNVGLLVKTAGRVTYKDPAGAFAYVDDGSAQKDGNALGVGGADVKGVRVILPAGISMASVGSFLVVYGVSSVVRVSGVSVRALRPITYVGEMVDVPAGSFQMGNSGVGKDAAANYSDERPQHFVYLSGYSIGKYEVTRGEWRMFMNAGGYTGACRKYWSDEGWAWRDSIDAKNPESWSPTQYLGSPPGYFTQTDSYCVGGVNYYEAEAFCNWAGCRLPTEAEWEKAARWDGHPRVYPWGDVWNAQKCNGFDDSLYPGYQTAPVGCYPLGASPYGCLDMAANISEWCRDWYGETYYSATPSGGWVNPQGPTGGTYRVLRGGCWYDSYDSCRCAYRQSAEPDHVCFGWLNAGFRTAKSR